MRRGGSQWLLALIASGLFTVHSAVAAEGSGGQLVSVQWLEKNLARDDVLVIDASPAKLHSAGHIPGAVSVDLFSFGGRESSAAEMERRIQSWGVSAGKKVVLYDQGGTYLATSLFFDLYYHGFPPTRSVVLDGGLAKWQAAGGRSPRTRPRAEARNVPRREAQRGCARPAAGVPGRFRRPGEQRAGRSAGAELSLRRRQVLRPRRPCSQRHHAAQRATSSTRTRPSSRPRRSGGCSRTSASGPNSRSTPTAAAASPRACRSSPRSSCWATPRSSSTRNPSWSGCATTAGCRSGPMTRRT